MSDHMAFNALLDENTLLLRDIATDLAGFARWASAFLDGECRYDHNDNCQQHACDPAPCPVERVRLVLDRIDEIEGYE